MQANVGGNGRLRSGALFNNGIEGKGYFADQALAAIVEGNCST